MKSLIQTVALATLFLFGQLQLSAANHSLSGTTLTITGSGENDVIIISGTSSQVKFGSSTVKGPVSSIIVNGGDGDDQIINNTSIQCVLNGGNGNDFLAGGSADGDELNGEYGDDGLFGGEWVEDDDGVIAKRSDKLIGGRGKDRLYVGLGKLSQLELNRPIPIKPLSIKGKERFFADRYVDFADRFSARCPDYLFGVDARVFLGNPANDITTDSVRWSAQLTLPAAKWSAEDVRRVDEAVHLLIKRTGVQTVMRHVTETIKLGDFERVVEHRNVEMLFLRYGRPNAIYRNGLRDGKPRQEMYLSGTNDDDGTLKFNENAFTWYGPDNQDDIRLDTDRKTLVRENGIKNLVWHELAHNWDTPEEFKRYFPSLVERKGDQVTAFRKFAGWKKGTKKPSDKYRKAGSTDETNSSGIKETVQWWYVPPPAGQGKEFVYDYGMTNPNEDWATSFSMFMHGYYNLKLYLRGGIDVEEPWKIRERCKARYDFFNNIASSMN